MRRIMIGGLFSRYGEMIPDKVYNDSRNWYGIDKLSEEAILFYGYLLRAFDTTAVIYFSGKTRAYDIEEKTGLNREAVLKAIDELIENKNLKAITEASYIFNVHQRSISREEFMELLKNYDIEDDFVSNLGN